jgi:hypothetical protein
MTSMENNTSDLSEDEQELITQLIDNKYCKIDVLDALISYYENMNKGGGIRKRRKRNKKQRTKRIKRGKKTIKKAKK